MGSTMGISRVERVCWLLVFFFSAFGAAEVGVAVLSAPTGCALIAPATNAAQKQNESTIGENKAAIDANARAIEFLKSQPSTPEIQAKIAVLDQMNADLAAKNAELEKRNKELSLKVESTTYDTIGKVAEYSGLIAAMFVPVAGIILSRVSSVAKSAKDNADAAIKDLNKGESRAQPEVDAHAQQIAEQQKQIAELTAKLAALKAVVVTKVA